MMRKHLLFYALLCCIAFGLSNCKIYDDPSSPSKSSLIVDQSSGLAGVTVFKFTITQVSARTYALLPEGDGKPGILVDNTSFVDGKASVTYTYSGIGIFKPVVKTTTYSEDGKTVLSVVSDPVTVTITSDNNSITAFTFASPNSTSTVITDKDASDVDTIEVLLPYKPYHTIGLAALKATFTASAFSSVTVGSTAQVSGTTANDFSQPVTYTVTSASGDFVRTYKVNVSIMPVGTGNDLKSASATVLSKGDLKGKSYSAFIDNVNKIVAVVLPSDGDNLMLDSLSFSYSLNDSTSRGDVAQGDTLDLKGTNFKTLNVLSQSGSTASYKVYAVIAPTFDITISNLTPNVEGVTTGFDIKLTCLKGTDLADLAFSYNVSGVTTVSYNNGSFASGTSVDYSSVSKQNFVLTVTDKGITYSVTYAVSVVTVP